jgi:hypothetical protein
MKVGMAEERVKGVSDARDKRGDASWTTQILQSGTIS